MSIAPDDEEVGLHLLGCVGYPAGNRTDFNVNLAVDPGGLQQPCEIGFGMVE